MPPHAKLQLGRLIVTPFTTIGVLVSRQLRRDIDNVADHYAALLRTADEQSRKAETANRVKDEFLATLSHELRTPLNSVLGWARLLASGKLDPAQSAHAVQAIERAGWAQSHVIEDLLDISRIVSGKLELNPRPTIAGPLVEAAIESLRPAAEAKRIAVDVSIDAAPDPGTVDPDRLQQVSSNLLSNAIKFTPGGGRVTVFLASDGDELHLALSDTGLETR